MKPLLTLSFLALTAPLCGMTGDLPLSFEPLTLGSPQLITESSFLTGIDSIDTPLGSPFEIGHAIIYPSEVLLAPVAFFPGSSQPIGIPQTGAVPSFQRWLASGEAQSLVPDLNLPSESSAVFAANDDSSEPLDAAPVALTVAALSGGAIVLRRHRRPAPQPLAHKRLSSCRPMRALRALPR